MADSLGAQEQASTRAFWYGLLFLIGILLVASAALYLVIYTLPMKRSIVTSTDVVTI